jgi:hypothetical protein
MLAVILILRWRSKIMAAVVPKTKSNDAQEGPPRWTYIVAALVAAGGLLWGMISFFIPKPDPPKPSIGATPPATPPPNVNVTVSGSGNVGVGTITVVVFGVWSCIVHVAGLAIAILADSTTPNNAVRSAPHTSTAG